ncbi:MAG: hypothetical protein K1060chlam2_01532, partial [Chlamydiae bacterium]|nr:hypothetical protein [Chlamydiota bacterium]
EKGRSVVVRWRDGEAEDLLPAPYSARSRVHEYGGGSFTVHDGFVYFSNYSDQHLYLRSSEGEISPLTQGDSRRYANPIFDSWRALLFAVEEVHRSDGAVENRLVTIQKEGGIIDVIHEGWDFYSMAALHPKGTHLAFLTWNHPNMPWDGTTLWVGELTPDGTLINLKEVAGGVSESIFQPQWSPDGTLYFVSDRSGFWNLYRLGEREVEACYPMEAEFGEPLWVFGMSRYGFLPDGKIAAIYTVKGIDSLGVVDPDENRLERLELPFTSLSNLKVQGALLYFMGASPTEVKSLIRYDFKTVERIRLSKRVKLDVISVPEMIEFPTEEGLTTYGFFYPPKNRNFTGSDLPPLIVKCHGGPSARVTSALNLEIQFWTSRGIAFLDMNYGGSTGFGREYRERLKGKWGIVDVDDCTNSALYLAEQGRVDPDRMAIKGGSAGGYTTLAALTFKDIFKAGASYYGVSDLEALVHEMHKFESHYLEGLIGPYPMEKKRYIEYSPIHHTDRLSCPVILFQGAEDKVVPPSQAEKMFEALNKKKIPVAYLLFEGEQHGFRNAENIKRALDAELFFYSKIFGFESSDSLEPITIHNLP